MIVIVNYGSGNIRAICHIYDKLGISYRVVAHPNELIGAAKIVLPGVGAFDQAMGNLEKSGMREALEAKVRGEGVPLLGICVGMQILANSSDEGEREGLGWIPGTVRKIERLSENADMRLPHMGWNTVTMTRPNHLFEKVELEAGFYFLHSYCLHCDDTAAELGSTYYSGRFTSVVNSGCIYGVQFHPEKSHHAGVQLLDNFARLV